MKPADVRTAWIATCVFWAWSWTCAAFASAPFTLGLSLVMLIPAGLSVWAICIPIGRTDREQPPAFMQQPAPAQLRPVPPMPQALPGRVPQQQPPNPYLR